jgi:hypothetical protein
MDKINIDIYKDIYKDIKPIKLMVLDTETTRSSMRKY